MKDKKYYFELITCLLFCMFSVSYGQIINVQGRIMTDSCPVSYCKINFINEDDTTKQFSTISDSNGYYKIGITTKVEQGTKERQDEHNLMQNYPNPFMENTVISYKLPFPNHIDIKIYNILGQLVKNIKTGNESPGFHQIIWDGRDNNGKRVSYGIYFYRIETKGWSESRKMLYLSGVSSFSGFSSFKGSIVDNEKSLNKKQYLEKGYYTTRIINTNNTQPVIKEKEFKHIPIKKDTTIDFIVEQKNTDYLFVEILRNTNGKVIGERHGYVNIDFCPYSFDSINGILRIISPFSYNFDSLGTSTFVLAHDRTIDGDLGEGHAGFVFAVYDFPYKIPITAFPLPYKDSIKIDEYNDVGDIIFEYDGNKVILNINNEWKYLREYNIDINLGSFKIKDEIIVKNHGWQKKSKIILIY